MELRIEVSHKLRLAQTVDKIVVKRLADIGDCLGIALVELSHLSVISDNAAQIIVRRYQLAVTVVEVAEQFSAHSDGNFDHIGAKASSSQLGIPPNIVA